MENGTSAGWDISIREASEWIPLAEHIEKGGGGFEYKGHYYTDIKKPCAESCRIITEQNIVPCLNVKIRSVRGINDREHVRPVCVHLIISHLT